MLVEFSVENHRSFREKQTFSMVAGVATERADPGHVARTGFQAMPHVLHEACIFGANGSGKSSLIGAMAFMSGFVRRSFHNEADRGIRADPFLFHGAWREKPSSFEAIFIHNDTLYQYGFALTRERVMEEWLFARPKSTGRDRVLFTRTYDEGTNDYDWTVNSTHLKGERNSWKSQTRPDALFLSTAVQLNAEGLKEAYEWLAHRFKMFDPSGSANGGYTALRFGEKSWKDKVSDFLKRADISLHDIQVEEENLFDLPQFKQLPETVRSMIRENDPEAKSISVSFCRLDDLRKSIPLPLNEESSGTKALFELAGPIIDVLENGYTVAVDELNSGFHPLVFQHLIAMFCDPEINRHNAQLIFTTHDTSVTERGCIHRDQIWLTEKHDDFATRLIPFSDFKTRNVRPFQKGYLQGRYGAVPRISA